MGQIDDAGNSIKEIRLGGSVEEYDCREITDIKRAKAALSSGLKGLRDG